MNATPITVLTLTALLAVCATSKPPSSTLGKSREGEVRREVAAAIERRRDAYERRDVAALEKLLARLQKLETLVNQKLKGSLK